MSEKEHTGGRVKVWGISLQNSKSIWFQAHIVSWGYYYFLFYMSPTLPFIPQHSPLCAKRKQTKKGILPFISDIWAEEVTCAVTRRRCSKQRQIRYKVEKSHFKMLLYQQSVTYRLTFNWTVHRHSQQAEKSNVKQKGGPVIVWPLCWQSGWNGGQRQAHPDWGKVKPDTTCRLSGSNPKSPVCFWFSECLPGLKCQRSCSVFLIFICIFICTELNIYFSIDPWWPYKEFIWSMPVV